MSDLEKLKYIVKTSKGPVAFVSVGDPIEAIDHGDCKPRTYRIVRVRHEEGRDNLTIKRGLTLRQAQEWCRDPKSMKAGVWFDGYEEE